MRMWLELICTKVLLLGYGSLTLLRDAKMQLKQNRFYGLLGPNQWPTPRKWDL